LAAANRPNKEKLILDRDRILDGERLAKII